MNNLNKSVFEKGETEEDKLTRFVAGGIISIIALIVGGLFGMVLWVIFITKLLGPEDFGIVGPAFNFFWLVCNIIAFGIPQTIVTFVSHNYETNLNESKKFITEGTKLLCINSIIFLFISNVILFILFYFNKIQAISFILYSILTLGITLNIFFWTTNAAINGFQRLDYVSFGNIAFPVSMFTVSIILVTIIQVRLGKETLIDTIGAIAGIPIGGLCAYLVALFFFHKLKIMKIKEIYAWRKSYGLIKKIIKFGGTSAIALTVHASLTFIAPVIVGLITSLGWLNLKQSGYFSTGMLYAGGPTLIIGLTFALLPAISEAEAQGKHELVQKYFTLTLKYSFFLLTIFFIGYAAFIGKIIELLSGKEYPGYILGPITTVCVSGVSFFALKFILLNLFIAIKKPHIPAIILSLSLILQIILLFILSYFYRKCIIISFAVFTSGVFGTACMLYYLIRKVNLKIPLFTYLIPGLAGVSAFSVVYFLLPKTFNMLGINAIVLGTIFYLLYVFFGGWDSDDLKMFRETILSIKFMKHLTNFLEFSENITKKSPFFEWYKRN